MSITPPDELPAEITYGYVMGRYLLAVGDGPDAGRLPDGRPATGMTVTFTPATVTHHLVSPPTTVLQASVPCEIGLDGYLREKDIADGTLGDEDEGEPLPGVWLIAGIYRVTFGGLPSHSLPKAFDVEVTSAHTEAAPLDLTLAAPLTPSPAVKFVVNEQVYTDTMTAIQNLEEGIVEVSPTQPAETGIFWVNPEEYAGSDIGSLVGEGQPNGAVTASIGTSYIDTLKTAGAIRWFKTTDGGNTGWECVYGDTGNRLVTVESIADGYDGSPNPGIWWPHDESSHTIYVRRTHKGVYFFASIQWDQVAATKDEYLCRVPEGFRPLRQQFKYQPQSQTLDNFFILMQGTYPQTYAYTGMVKVSKNCLQPWSMPDIEFYYADVRDPWPTTLPGEAW